MALNNPRHQHHEPEEPDDHHEQPEGSQALTPQVVPTSPAPHSDADVGEIIEARNRLMSKLLDYAIRATSPEHWSDQGGKPYLDSAGAQAAARRCAVKVRNVSYTREEHTDSAGKYFEFVYRGDFSLPGNYDLLEGVTGSCNSRDPLIGTNFGKREDSEVDPGDIRKKAHTNMMQRGITQLLGIRGLSWKTLAKYGVSADGALKVEYQTGAKGGGHQGEEFAFKFGRGKGKPLSQLTEEDLGWYLKSGKEDLAKPEKAKYRDNTEKQIKLVEDELARRKNAAAGVGQQSGERVSIWKQIQSLADAMKFKRGEKDAALISLVKKATSDKPGKDLNDEDLKKVEAALNEAVENDIPY